uniref:Uncharacterized protein n=1 Tax=Zea mays TaxID=4577 RepID=A0A804Q0K1_MAIZE
MPEPQAILPLRALPADAPLPFPVPASFHPQAPGPGGTAPATPPNPTPPQPLTPAAPPSSSSTRPPHPWEISARAWLESFPDGRPPTEPEGASFVLGRMGNAKEALSTIINKLEDMQEAVEFVTEQHDDELWEELIRQCLQKPEMVGNLLEHTVGNLDPLYIVSLVPDGLEIPRLQDRLVKIVTDYRTETSL